MARQVPRDTSGAGVRKHLPFRELIISKSHRYRSFANCTIAKDDDFVLGVWSSRDKVTVVSEYVTVSLVFRWRAALSGELFGGERTVIATGRD